MFDYIVRYEINNIEKDKIITIEQYIEDSEILEDLLLEQLKDSVETDEVEILDFESVNKQDNLYRFEYKDIYGVDRARYDYDEE